MATARVHITQALQHLGVLPVGVSPSTTDDEPDCLVSLNNMLGNWSERRSRADLMAKQALTKVMELCAGGAQIALTGSSARTALENAAAAAASGFAVSAPTALSTYSTITTDNSYTTGFDHAIQWNLAAVLAPRYNREITPALAAEAKAAYDAVMPPIAAGG